MSDTTVTYGTTTTTKKNTFTRTGYIFTCWHWHRQSDNKWHYTKADGTQGWYVKGQQPSGATLAEHKDGTTSTTSSAVHGDIITMYAQWTPKTLTVVYHKNDGSGRTSTQSFTYGVEGNKFGYNTDGTPKWTQTGQFGTWDRTGYELLGWDKDPSATEATYPVYSNVTDGFIDNNYPSIDLYAVWKSKHLAHIHSGTEVNTYGVYIHDGKQYDRYGVYRHDGTSWNLLS